MKISSCRSYHAITSSYKLLEMQGNQSVFKIYYISIIGRDKPELYEWEHHQMSKEQFEEMFKEKRFEGIGFVTAFPHITKIFRFCPGMETVLDIAEFDTTGLTSRDCTRDDGYHEFACYAEAVIAAEEYHYWAKADSVKEYLELQVQTEDFPVVSNAKLGEYWHAEKKK